MIWGSEEEEGSFGKE
jgi:hypothetical protein